MPLGSTEPPPLDAATALLNHLRRNPGDAFSSPGDLAKRFGLPEAFVIRVLQGVRVREVDDTPARAKKQWDAIKDLWSKGGKLFDRITRNPMRFVIFSTLITLAIFALVSQARPNQFSIKFGGIEAANTGLIAVILTTFGVHMVCYFRHGMSRYPLFGGLFVWVVTATAVAIEILRTSADKTTPERIGSLVLVALGMFVLSSLYASAGALFAVVGGYLRAKAAERHEEQQSRQDLLGRFFELQERLKQGQMGMVTEDWLLDNSVSKFFHRAPALITAIFSASVAIALIIISAAGKFSRVASPGTFPVVMIVFVALQGILFLVTLLMYIGIGLFSGTPVRALLLSLVASAAEVCCAFIPIGEFGLANWIKNGTYTNSAVRTVLEAFVVLIASVGADLQRRAQKTEALQRNDPATLLAEMLRIQLRLGEHASNICVMVVDAAKSAGMKASADPLTVEYSFREYQEWLEEVSERYAGRVHSTAGDGAVVAFPTCDQAFQAARTIQTDLARFNREVNRLETPFRLRVGLHVGQVVGDLDEVEFTEVIDIAAHVQAAAPIAGIAVTDDVASSMPSEEFIPLAQEIDGHRVLIALNPTED